MKSFSMNSYSIYVYTTSLKLHCHDYLHNPLKFDMYLCEYCMKHCDSRASIQKCQ